MNLANILQKIKGPQIGQGSRVKAISRERSLGPVSWVAFTADFINPDIHTILKNK